MDLLLCPCLGGTRSSASHKHHECLSLASLRLIGGQQAHGSLGLQVLQSLSLSGGTEAWVAPAQFGFIGHLGSACGGSQAAPPSPGKHPLSLTHRELGPSWDRKESRRWGCFGAFPPEERPSCSQLARLGASLTIQEDKAHKQDKRQMVARGVLESHVASLSESFYVSLYPSSPGGHLWGSYKHLEGCQFPLESTRQIISLPATVTEHLCSSERWTM